MPCTYSIVQYGTVQYLQVQDAVQVSGDVVRVQRGLQRRGCLGEAGRLRLRRRHRAVEVEVLQLVRGAGTLARPLARPLPRPLASAAQGEAV